MKAPWNRGSWFAAACHKSTDTGGQNTTQTSTPWPAQKQALTTGYNAASSNILNNPTSFFGGQTFPDFSPETQAALGTQTDRAVQGNPLLGQAQDYTGDVLGGQYLDPASNPFFQGTMDSIISAIRPGVDSMFAGGGRAGSPAHAEALGRGVSRGAMPYFANEYGRERGIMEGAANRAPGLAREDYFDPGQLAGVGAQREGQAQRGINEDIARFEFGENEPASRTRDYLASIQGMPTFGTTTGAQQNTANTGLLAAGTAMKLIGK